MFVSCRLLCGVCCCLLFAVCRMLIGVRNWLFVVCCLLFVVCGCLFDVVRLALGVWCVLFGVCVLDCSLFVVRCLQFDA